MIGTQINGSAYTEGDAAQMIQLGLNWTLMDFEAGVRKQLDHQESKWGVQDHAIGVWGLILLEELGEVAKAILEGDFEGMQKEVHQSGACLVQLAAKMERAREIDQHAVQ